MNSAQLPEWRATAAPQQGNAPPQKIDGRRSGAGTFLARTLQNFGTDPRQVLDSLLKMWAPVSLTLKLTGRIMPFVV